jgi:anti-sigma B factor antagonist
MTGFSIRRTADCVQVAGDIDVLTAPQLKSALLEYAPRDGSALTVDISRVPFIDSSGLNVLLHLARGLSGELVLLRPSRGVARLFSITGAEGFPGLTVSYGQAA